MTRQFVRSYRAKSLHDALRMVRDDLGPHAAVLDTKEVWDGWFRGLMGKRRVEVTASVPISRPIQLAMQAAARPTNHAVIPPHERFPERHADSVARAPESELTVTENADRFRELEKRLGRLRSRIDGPDETMFKLYTEMVEAEFAEDEARDLIGLVRAEAGAAEMDYGAAYQRLRATIESMIRVGRPLQTTAGNRRTVALVGPTGVGKTTTIAKLAANLRLRDKKNVGLITVDTYRIAAVEQLRTYADIIDLPMEVVSTPREMREAINRIAHLDLVLMDTAGRSPRDEIKLQELKMMLGEAGTDEVHLVMSATSSAKALATTARHFSGVGATSLLLTKLDEATGLGHLLGLLRDCPLPISYLTNGQNVPDDIQVAHAGKLSDWLLGRGRDALAAF